MFIVRLLRFIKGVVTFTVSGGFVERFLNISARSGINIYNLKHEQSVTTGCTAPKNYKRLRGIAKKSRVKMRLKSKKGLPFLLLRYRRRYGLVFGLLAMALFFIIMGQFLWRIDIVGLQTVSEDRVREILNENGVRIGAYMRGIDVFRAENELIINIPEFSWTAVNLHASSAEVCVKEREAPPEMIDGKTPCNIIAGRTGQIVKLTVYEGSAALRVGDTVEKGELVVNSYVEGIVKRERGYFVHSRAEVIAEFTEEFSVEVPLSEEILVPTGENKNRRTLNLFGLDIPLFIGKEPGEGFRKSTEQGGLSLLGLKLPMSLTTERYEGVRATRTTLTESEARELAMEKLFEREQELAAQGQVMGKTTHGEVQDGKFSLFAEFVVRQEIGVKQPLEVHNTDPRFPGAPLQEGIYDPTAAKYE